MSTSFSGMDTNGVASVLPPTQRVRLMGLSFLPKQVRPEIDPWHQGRERGRSVGIGPLRRPLRRVNAQPVLTDPAALIRHPDGRTE